MSLKGHFFPLGYGLSNFSFNEHRKQFYHVFRQKNVPARRVGDLLFTVHTREYSHKSPETAACLELLCCGVSEPPRALSLVHVCGRKAHTSLESRWTVLTMMN